MKIKVLVLGKNKGTVLVLGEIKLFLVKINVHACFGAGGERGGGGGYGVCARRQQDAPRSGDPSYHVGASSGTCTGVAALF